MIEKTSAKYLEFRVNNFMNGLIILSQSGDFLYDDDEMETLYALGYNFFTCGKYDEAKAVFRKLTACAPKKAQYWRALGAVDQQKKDYADAIVAYGKAIANDGKDIVNYVYRAESKILSGHCEDGIKDLEEVTKIGSEDPSQTAWLKRAELLIRLHMQH